MLILKRLFLKEFFQNLCSFIYRFINKGTYLQVYCLMSELLTPHSQQTAPIMDLVWFWAFVLKFLSCPLFLMSLVSCVPCVLFCFFPLFFFFFFLRSVSLCPSPITVYM